ncbi:hypothetical protein, partial [Bacillus anthracis]|uniref:hypothetical protein n=1 Tax=Bacillus anthracis TaxID=1392 RepID=UPI0039A77E16
PYSDRTRSYPVLPQGNVRLQFATATDSRPNKPNYHFPVFFSNSQHFLAFTPFLYHIHNVTLAGPKPKEDPFHDYD